MTFKCLEEYAESQGIDIIYAPLPDFLNGAAKKIREGEYRIYMNAELCDLPVMYQKIYTAHEIGHCEKDLFVVPYNCHFKPLIWRLEYQAWKQAVLRLVPEHEILRAVRREGLCESWELADYFEVPDEFMRFAICYYKQIPYERFW